VKVLKNLRFKGTNREFKEYLDKAIKDLDEKEKRSCTSANVTTPRNYPCNKLYQN